MFSFFRYIFIIFLFVQAPIVFAQQININNRLDGVTGQGTVLERGNENTEDSEEQYQRIQEQGSWLLQLNFPWPEKTGAAVFRRNNQIWLVFDYYLEFELLPVRNNARPIIEAIYQQNSSNGSVLIMTIPEEYHFSLEANGNEWDFNIFNEAKPRKKIYKPRVLLTPERGKILNVSDNSASGVVGTIDRLTGSILFIGTTTDVAIGQSGLKRYQGFNLIDTSQGLAVESFLDGIRLDSKRDGFSVASVTKGFELPVSLSDEEDGEAIEVSAYYSERFIFKWKEWHGSTEQSFVSKLHEHFQAVSSVDNQNLNNARLSLARYYLSYQFGAEAIGIMNAIFRNYPFLYDLPEMKALNAVALFYGHKYNQALDNFKHEQLDYLSEVLLWRGAVYAKLRQWEESEKAFKIGEKFILEYPTKMQFNISLLRIESAIQTGNKETAAGWINFLSNLEGDFYEYDMSKLEFIRGLYMAKFEENKNEPVKIFNKLRLDRNKLINTRSRFNLTKILYEGNKIDIKEAITELNSVRYGWRGDIIEAEIILVLAEYYLNDGQHAKGLSLLRNGVEVIPSAFITNKMNTLMEGHFKKLFYDGLSDNISPLQALALYDDFRELTPPGTEGDYIIERLSMRLLSIDLIERAISLLEYQIRYRLEGVERSRVGTKLAVYYLLNKDADKAASVIEDTRFPGLDAALLSERRRILAKAFIDRTDYMQARRLLVGDVTRDSELLRLEVFWELEDWFEVANVLRRLIGRGDANPDQELSATKARLIYNLAVALKLIDDLQGQENLRDDYLVPMSKTVWANSFNDLTASAFDDVNLGIDGNILQQISGEEFNLFIDRYRDRVLTPSEPFLGLQNRAVNSETLQNKNRKEAEVDDNNDAS